MRVASVIAGFILAALLVGMANAEGGDYKHEPRAEISGAVTSQTCDTLTATFEYTELKPRTHAVVTIVSGIDTTETHEFLADDGVDSSTSIEVVIDLPVDGVVTASLEVEKYGELKPVGEPVVVEVSGENTCASISLHKVADGAEDIVFNFVGSLGDFSLINGETIVADGLTEGTYSITEEANADWPLSSITCLDAEHAVTDNTVTINLAEAQDAVCVITNEAVEVEPEPEPTTEPEPEPTTEPQPINVVVEQSQTQTDGNDGPAEVIIVESEDDDDNGGTITPPNTGNGGLK